MRQGSGNLISAVAVLLAASLVFSGCQSPKASPASPEVHPMVEGPGSAAGEAGKPCPLSKPGFIAVEEEGRLWVLRPGEEKSEKHVTLVGAGPNGMTIKALSRKTALEYLASKPGFSVEVDDENGRVWAWKDGQEKEKSEKHVTLVGAGPRGMTVKALDRDTAVEYVVSVPGFRVEVEEGRIWVLLPGQEKNEKHITLVGAGPLGMTVKALDKETAMNYIACASGSG